MSGSSKFVILGLVPRIQARVLWTLATSPRVTTFRKVNFNGLSESENGPPKADKLFNQ